MHNFKTVIIGFIAGCITIYAISSIATESKITRAGQCTVPTMFCQNLKPLED